MEHLNVEGRKFKKHLQILFRKKMNRKINGYFLLIGFMAVVASVLMINYTQNSLIILKNGNLAYCPVIHIDYSARGGNHAFVMLNGQKISAGQVENSIEINDTIAIRYIEGESRVVIAKNKFIVYYFFFVIEGILFVLGVTIIIGGFMGKSIYDSYTPRKNNRRKHKKK